MLSDLTIVVLSHNRIDEVRRNLPELCHLVQEYNAELVVVDSNSSDGSDTFIAGAILPSSSSKAILLEDNKGVSAGRNMGWTAASRDYVLSLDDDAIVPVEGIVAMLEHMRAHPEIGILSPRVIHRASKEPQLDLGDTTRSIANYHGACHLVRRALFSIIGPHDEANDFGAEELDMSIRSRVANFDVVYFPHATALHNSLARGPAEDRRRRIQWARNHFRVYYSHFDVGFASLLAMRNLLSMGLSGVRKHGLRFALELSRSAVDGATSGRKMHKPLPSAVAHFYRHPAVREAMGNVSLGFRIRRHLGRKKRWLGNLDSNQD